MNNITQAEVHIKKLIPTAVCAEGREQVNTNGHTVTFTLTHPKRKLTINSVANAARKNGLTVYGTKSATNRNEFIVAYVNVDAKVELCAHGSNSGDLVVEVRVKQ